MAKLHYFYSTMNAGKSTSLLQSNHNYLENNLNTLLFVPKENEDFNKGKIVSRIGLEAEAIIVNSKYNFYENIKKLNNDVIHCILIDEAQFLSTKQIHELSEVADSLNIPVMCYGIRTDFRGELFEGSSALLALADNLIELKTVCSECPRKATMVVRLNEEGKIVTEGSQVQLGGNDVYKVVCRRHFRKLTNLI
jgi:thymidine kinase